VELLEGELDATFYSSRCRLCFRPKSVTAEKVDEAVAGADSSEESSSDSSSDSD